MLFVLVKVRLLWLAPV